MPAPQRYPAPQEQIFALAVQARREGLDFDAFWDRAIRPGRDQKLVTTETVRTAEPPFGAVIWPKDSTDRGNAIAAAQGAKETWRRTYERRPPTPGEVALKQLAGMLFPASASSPPPPSGGTSNRTGLQLAA